MKIQLFKWFAEFKKRNDEFKYRNNEKCPECGSRNTDRYRVAHPVGPPGMCMHAEGSKLVCFDCRLGLPPR